MLKEKQLVRFLALAAILYGLWFTLYEFLLKPNGTLDHLLTGNITIAICRLLDLVGYNTSYTIARKLGETYIYLDHNPIPVIRVGASCNGLELLVLFSIFVICYPGKWKVKIPFLLAGNVAIHLLNILRNFFLSLMSIHRYAYFEFFHRYVFVFMVYGSIFLLWMLWANKYSYSGITREPKAK